MLDTQGSTQHSQFSLANCAVTATQMQLQSYSCRHQEDLRVSPRGHRF